MKKTNKFNRKVKKYVNETFADEKIIINAKDKEIVFISCTFEKCFFCGYNPNIVMEDCKLIDCDDDVDVDYFCIHIKNCIIEPDYAAHPKVLHNKCGYTKGHCCGYSCHCYDES